jgi:hypothetical protein
MDKAIWVKVVSMDSDVWRDKDGRQKQPQMKRISKRGREYRMTIEGYPPLVGEVGKVCKIWHEEDGDFYAIQFAQELMQTCPQDYWLFKPEDVEEIPGADFMEQIQKVQLSWFKTM